MIIDEIDSLKDEKIQQARKLNSVKGRADTKKMLIEGVQAIQWAFDSGVVIDYLLISNKNKDIAAMFPDQKRFFISEGLLKKVTGTSYLIPTVAVGNISETVPENDFIVVLDSVRDFGNMGTIIRTCHAFGIRSVVSSNKDMDLFQRKTVNASRGKVFATDYHDFQNPNEAITFLKNMDYLIVTTSPYGNSIQSLVSLPDKPVALIVGNETNGASDVFIKNADLTIQIPMQGEVESLNVGVAAGISIYELKLKQVLGMIEKKIKSTLGRELSVAAMLLQEVLDRKLQQVSYLSSQQLVFLMVLKCDVTMKKKDMQKQFGIPDSEVDAFFKVLIANHLVTRDAADIVAITETGVEIIGKLWAIIENTENDVLKGFSNIEKKELLRLIRKMQKTCSRLIHEG